MPLWTARSCVSAASLPGMAAFERGRAHEHDVIASITPNGSMRMDVPGLVRLFTVLGIVGQLGFDFVFPVRRAHIPSLREAGTWSAVYVGIALLFGVGVWVFGGSTMGRQRIREEEKLMTLLRRVHAEHDGRVAADSNGMLRTSPRA